MNPQDMPDNAENRISSKIAEILSEEEQAARAQLEKRAERAAQAEHYAEREERRREYEERRQKEDAEKTEQVEKLVIAFYAWTVKYRMTPPSITYKEFFDRKSFWGIFYGSRIKRDRRVINFVDDKWIIYTTPRTVTVYDNRYDPYNHLRDSGPAPRNVIGWNLVWTSYAISSDGTLLRGEGIGHGNESGKYTREALEVATAHHRESFQPVDRQYFLKVDLESFEQGIAELVLKSGHPWP